MATLAPAAVNRVLLHRAARPVVHLLCAAPLVWLLLRAFGIVGSLGANPAEALIRSSGDWTLRLLCATLAVTPLRQAFGWSGLARYRRALGVWTFAWASLHFLAYAWLDMGLVPADILRDIPKRPFILVGTAAWLGLLPLAATSFNRAIRALGAARWQTLHRAVYAVVLLALLHFFWMKAGKQDFAEWSAYALVVAVLLGWRLQRAIRHGRPARPAMAPPGHGGGPAGRRA